MSSLAFADRICPLPTLLLAVALTACAPREIAPPSTVAPVDPTATQPTHRPEPYVRFDHPDWARTAVLYQINTRQFTPEGTLIAARAQLPRLKALGADILWLMPIHPIGEQNRKGSLGSPYSVRDYYGVNPEFGTLDDLKAFVAEAHRLGMRVILDWVANHTAWDNPLVEAHPDWYERDWDGDFRPTPWWDWSDIIDLDYRNPELRRYMAEAMKFWVSEVGIDGFRCDVAGYVPLDFWETIRTELDAIKPVFMLAEYEGRDVHRRAFDASYAWSWNNALHRIAIGEADVSALYGYYSENESAWPQDAYRMTYLSNHDQNAWEATQFERFGPALEAGIVLSVLGEGIPLIYNGQEAGNRKRLAFFEKDPIVWQAHPIGELYRDLIALKKGIRALGNGAAGARMVPVVHSAPREVFAFVRDDGEHGVLVLLNLSADARSVALLDGPFRGRYREWPEGDPIELTEGAELTLPAWGHRVLVIDRSAGDPPGR